MLRRRFLGMTGVLSAVGLAGGAMATAAERSTVRYRVKGFTCITCAVGLETLLGREHGVLSAKATYPEGIATVVFHPREVSEARLLELMGEMGFVAERLG